METNVAAYQHCHYSQLTFKGKDTRSPITLFQAKKGGRYDPNVEVGIIAGDQPENFSFKVNPDAKAEDCVYEGEPQDHHENMFFYDEPSLPETIQVNNHAQKEVSGTAKFDYGGNVFKFLWLAGMGSEEYPVLNLRAESCRYHHQIMTTVYPDIEWELAFELLINASNYKAANMPSGNVYAKHQEKARKKGYDRWQLNENGRVPIAVGVGLWAKWNDGNSKLGFTNQFSGKVEALAKYISKSVNILQGAINLAQSAAKKTAIPVGFDIRYPKFKVVGKWYLDRLDDQGVVNTVGEIGFEFKPLIGAEVVIDIIGAAIAAGSYATTGNPAAARLISKFRKGLDKLGASVTFTATFYGELSIMVDALKIDAINGIDMHGKSTIGGKMGVRIEFSMNLEIGKTNNQNIVPIDVSFRAAAYADAFFGGNFIIDSSNQGVFVQPILKFSGVKLTAEIEGEVGWWKTDFKVEEKIIDKDTWKGDKNYITESKT